MGNERSGIYLALCYQAQDFLTITAIYPTRLEDEINANIQKIFITSYVMPTFYALLKLDFF